MPLGHTAAGGCPKEAETPWEAWSRILAGLVDPRWSRQCAPWKRLILGQFTGDCHEREPMLVQGRSVRSLPTEEEGAAETHDDDMTTAPIPHPPALLRGGRKEIRSEVEPRKKGGVREKCFKIWSYFSLSCSNMIDNKDCTHFPKSNLFCLWW